MRIRAKIEAEVLPSGSCWQKTRTRAASSTRAAALRARSSKPSGARSSRPLTMGHLLHLQLRELQGIVPVGGQDAARLVVPGQTADARLDQLQAASVAQVLPMILQMCLKARSAFDQTGEILRQREFRPFGRENLSHAPTCREAHVRYAVGVSEPHADGGRRQALLVQADDRLLDLRLFHPDPFRIRLQVRSRRSALSLAVRMDASHRFPRGGAAHTAESYLRLSPRLGRCA